MIIEDLRINEKATSLVFSIQKIKNQKKWTREEDELLIQLAEKYSAKNWKEISKNFVKKNSLQCFSRYKRIRPGIIKGSWKKDEDARILDLVSLYGKAWSKISKILETRNGKQIRDRYINVLDPDIRKGKFTEEEDTTLIDLYHQHGPKWAAIAKYYPNRTADMVKNRFHSSIKKRLGLSLFYYSDPSRDPNKLQNDTKQTLQIQSNPNAYCLGSPCSINKGLTSSTGKTVLKPEPQVEVQKLYPELFSQDFMTDNQFNNEYGDKDDNMNNFFYSFDNNPFNMIKMDEPIQWNRNNEAEWNYDSFIMNS